MIDITENAIKRIKDISLKQESNLFRISVDGGWSAWSSWSDWRER